MKTIIRIFVLAVGLGALAVTAQMVHSAMWGRWEMSHLWNFIILFAGLAAFHIFQSP